MTSDGDKLEGEGDAHLDFVWDQLLPELVLLASIEGTGRSRLRRIERTIKLREIATAESGTDIG